MAVWKKIHVQKANVNIAILYEHNYENQTKIIHSDTKKECKRNTPPPQTSIEAILSVAFASFYFFVLS